MNKIRRRIYLTFIGGVFCAAAGSLIGSAVVSLLVVIKNWPNSASGVGTIFAGTLAFGTLTVAPFGLIVGLMGSWWLVSRLSGTVAFRQVVFESAGMGALLGASYPLVQVILGWGPPRSLVTWLPISIGTGAVCGVGLPLFMRKFKLIGKYG